MKNKELEKLLKEGLKTEKVSENVEQRGVGDILEKRTAELVEHAVGSSYFKPPESKRSIDDFTLVYNKQTQLYDVKTHFRQKKGGFSMPNLISVKRLRNDVLIDHTKTLSYIFIHYTREKKDEVVIQDIRVRYIWELDWSILRIGALGKGQLQIANANNDLKFTGEGKEKWFETLKDEVKKFYEKEIEKTGKEIELWESY